MKEKMYVAVMVSMMVATLMLVGVCGNWYTLNNCEVVVVDVMTTIVEDEQGNLWEYYPDTDNKPKVGDKVTLKMFGRCSDTIKDDIIVKVIAQ